MKKVYKIRSLQEGTKCERSGNMSRAFCSEDVDQAQTKSTTINTTSKYQEADLRRRRPKRCLQMLKVFALAFIMIFITIGTTGCDNNKNQQSDSSTEQQDTSSQKDGISNIPVIGPAWDWIQDAAKKAQSDSSKSESSSGSKKEGISSVPVIGDAIDWVTGLFSDDSKEGEKIKEESKQSNSDSGINLEEIPVVGPFFQTVCDSASEMFGLKNTNKNQSQQSSSNTEQQDTSSQKDGDILSWVKDNAIIIVCVAGAIILVIVLLLKIKKKKPKAAVHTTPVSSPTVTPEPTAPADYNEYDTGLDPTDIHGF